MDMEDIDTKIELCDFINTLSSVERTVVTNFLFNKMNRSNISKLLGIDRKTVGTIIIEVKKKWTNTYGK